MDNSKLTLDNFSSVAMDRPANLPAPQTSMQDLINLMAMLVRNINSLTTTVNQFIANACQTTASVSSTQSRSFVEKPSTFDGKSSEKARLFRSTFRVYICANKEIFAMQDTNDAIILDANGNWIMDPVKMITGVLSFMTDDTATEFVRQFLAKFEPVDAKNEAKQKLMLIKQDNRTFTDYLSNFETYSRRTGWSDNDLYDCLKSGMNFDYLNRLSYFTPLATNYNMVKNYGATIDLQKANLAANQGKPVS
ncbi:uncharacterized protein PHACADRAFT_199036 [Phanerochaete carnosa HHB-10118-sp]|uniref:Retrotransposon gag domain-containing protein n=1 Tax=Phanerochaete carnosa (strain HHB-10118-sp) TaxID=650164 RepID=K5VJK1_PHACS|nr:uncharacterized protein PHACADRAFT_199036 [Phanerochaete carnosa HHB-10118-sp]EKM51523.1 hypothetical protein PHACADRAFT_199036 [Phanerochaete carnosa HHB-10118-sp]